MTREEAISLLQRGIVGEIYDKKGYLTALGYEALEVIDSSKCPTLVPKKNGEWIPCEERLPVDLKDVLVWYEYYNYKFDKLKQTYGIGWIYEGMWNGDVCGEQARCIAWMPLPAPYRKEGDGE